MIVVAELLKRAIGSPNDLSCFIPASLNDLTLFNLMLANPV